MYETYEHKENGRIVMDRFEERFEESAYAYSGERCILEDKDLGICADVASVRTPTYSAAAAESFQGCPYTDTGFSLEAVVDGERVRAEEWKWLPNAMLRSGRTPDFTVRSLIAVVPGTRRFVMRVVLENHRAAPRTVPLRLAWRTDPRREETWEFSIPQPIRAKDPELRVSDRSFRVETETAAALFSSSVSDLRLFVPARLWEGEITLPPEGEYRFYVSAVFGRKDAVPKKEAPTDAEYEAWIGASFGWLERESRRIEENVPRLTSDCPALDALYTRSLVSYMLSRWENPDLCAVPYFSTGSVTGGCMCSYLWNYCGGLMLHPLYDAEGNKKQLLAYLKNDLTSSYALNPVTAENVGPWYQVNQEKIICMVYYHVLFTGDKEFLSETVNGKTVLDWMRFHARVCDDGSPENALFDYGPGGRQHLELRRGFLYDGVMPDLNARRYLNYVRAYELTKAAGQPDEELPRRAALLRERLRALWDPEARWYAFIGSGGKRDVRWTVQMFKFLNSPVIGEEEREGLISHLNEREFLSECGLHSMSKLDEAYDQDDIDNGGGGICGHFTMQICSQLYETGHDALAADILRRVLWWGERMPYFGDSVAANMIRNREDTPLQGDIASVSCAQTILFALFGIRAGFDGTVAVSPVRCRPARRMRMDNIRIAGKVFSVEADGRIFTVSFGGNTITAMIGDTAVL